MKEKMYRVMPLVFVAKDAPGYVAGEFWAAESAVGRFSVVYDMVSWDEDDGKAWFWDHPNEWGESAQDYADAGHPTRESAIAAATAWYERRVAAGMEEVT